MTGSSPPGAVMRSTGPASSQRASQSGSATVADKPDAAALRRHALESREAERQEIAALGAGERMQLVDDDALESPEDRRRVRVGQHERQRFGRRHQDLRRRLALALALLVRRVAGARLGADPEAHLGDRLHEIAMHVDGERLERREVEGVQSGPRPFGELDQAGQEPGQGLAAAGGRDEQSRAPRPRRLDHGELMGMGRPAALPEPGGEGRRQRRPIEQRQRGGGARHAVTGRRDASGAASVPPRYKAAAAPRPTPASARPDRR